MAMASGTMVSGCSDIILEKGQQGSMEEHIFFMQNLPGLITGIAEDEKDVCPKNLYCYNQLIDNTGPNE